MQVIVIVIVIVRFISFQCTKLLRNWIIKCFSSHIESLWSDLSPVNTQGPLGAGLPNACPHIHNLLGQIHLLSVHKGCQPPHIYNLFGQTKLLPIHKAPQELDYKMLLLTCTISLVRLIPFQFTKPLGSWMIKCSSSHLQSPW